MQNRKLGSNGPSVSAIGYGSMGFHAFYGAADTHSGLNVVRRAFELGVTFFDTAELYGWGESERFLGRAIKGFRDDVTIATKFGFTQEYGLNSSPQHIREVTENSLRYLGVDHIDVLYQHRLDPNIDIEEVAGAVQDLIAQGKVKYFGLCEVGPQTLRRAHAVQPVAALQTEYSVFERAVESVLPVCRELGVAVVPYSPLGRGFLTGSVKPADALEPGDYRRHDPRWQPGNYEKNMEIVSKLAALAERNNMSVAQLALAWLLSRGDDIIPIPGTRNMHRLEENLGAADIHLDEAVLHAIDVIVPNGSAGGRYAGSAMPNWT